MLSGSFRRSQKSLLAAFRTKAAFAPSQQIRPFFFDAAKYLLPHPLKVLKGGEDAAMCGGRYLGVADGVGGWESVGVDAGLYSRELLERVGQALQEHEDRSRFTPPPVEILKQAYHRTQAIGSSTVCLVFLDDFAKQLKAANLGDSGFLLFRPSADAVIGRSEPQCHDFNFPVQLGTGSADQPEHSETAQISVEEGDIAFLATDGVWDNLYEEDIVRVLKRSSNPATAAEEVARLAFAHSTDTRRSSPFSQRESSHTGSKGHMGGKSDDIAVVIGVVRDASNVAADTIPQEVVERMKKTSPPDEPS